MMTEQELNVLQEKIVVQSNMIKYGGSFVSLLGKALRKADLNNTKRIKEGFPDYWEQYLDMGPEEL